METTKEVDLPQSVPVLLGVRPWLREVRCMFLAVSLVVESAIFPFLHNWPLVLVATNSLVLLAGVYSVAVTRRRLLLLCLLSTLQIGSAVAHVLFGGALLFVISLLLMIWVYSVTIWVVLRYVLRGTVTADKLCGAVSVYFLIGFTWTCLYRLVLMFDPGAIQGAQAKDLVYFSLITLATIGYGDIRPVTDVARVLSMLEGITGVFYVATLVARLVNAYDSGRERSDG